MMPINEAKAITIEEAGFSVKTYQCLKRAKICTFGDIVNKTEKELYQVRNLGKKSMEEIIVKLKEHNLELATSASAKAEQNGRNTMAVQVTMRDTHGTIETDNWGVVTNAGTFDEKGNPIEGGMYDPDIFDIQEEDFAFSDSFETLSKYRKPEDVVGQMGVMDLALPVSDPARPSEINEHFWVHLTAIPVLPIAFREMSRDKRCISEEANTWNKLAELNFAIPALLAVDPTKKKELQARLQEAVDAVYKLYDRWPQSQEKFIMQLFVNHALSPIGIEEDYETVINRIKCIESAISMFDSRSDVETYSMALKNLCRYCTIVGYDTKEVNEYLEMAQNILDEIEELDGSAY